MHEECVRTGSRGKNSRVLVEPRVLTSEGFSAMALDGKAEPIKRLIPLGLVAIARSLEAEVNALVWERYSRKGSRRLASALLDIEPRLRHPRRYRHPALLRDAIQRELDLPGHEAGGSLPREVA